ncbi:lysophospholipid acyltransferase family protein [Pseudohongiella sp. SYSU M77423]|uniref:lysophospholipid acyltransferase family protein n=1 Tax=Pseudohongiella sp. SYSU M77423 TaxID=3042312 RepID=UPI00294FF896|nr:lysophospholipid acyltransferase family protein [Pseudohongiella sp. SYSU M77423]
MESTPIDTLKTAIIKFALNILAWLPLPALHMIGNAIGTVVYMLPTETRRVTLINLQRVFPELSAEQTQKLARESIKETIKTGLELGHMWCRSIDHVLRLIVSVDGMEHVEKAQASGKGIIYASPHLGSWEALGLYVSTLGPLTTLYKPPKIKGLNALVAGSRAKAGAELVATDRQGVVRLNKALLQGGATGILPDQQPRNEGGVFAPLFGIQAYTMTLVPKLASRTGSQVIFAYAERLSGGRGYHVVFEPADNGIYEADSASAAAAMNRSVERCIRALPSQYQWSYKRYRKRPDDDSERFY